MSIVIREEKKSEVLPRDFERMKQSAESKIECFDATYTYKKIPHTSSHTEQTAPTVTIGSSLFSLYSLNLLGLLLLVPLHTRCSRLTLGLAAEKQSVHYRHDNQSQQGGGHKAADDGNVPKTQTAGGDISLPAVLQ